MWRWNNFRSLPSIHSFIQSFIVQGHGQLPLSNPHFSRLNMAEENMSSESKKYN